MIIILNLRTVIGVIDMVFIKLCYNITRLSKLCKFCMMMMMIPSYQIFCSNFDLLKMLGLVSWIKVEIKMILDLDKRLLHRGD